MLSLPDEMRLFMCHDYGPNGREIRWETTVAENLLADLRGAQPTARYDGYGSCPLTVERGRIILAEFGYGGKLLPSFPTWLIDGQKPSKLAWMLKERLLPPVYWRAMLRGREWMAKPEKVSVSSTAGA